MCKRSVTVVALAVLLVTGAWSVAFDQQPISQRLDANQPGWVFNVAPYLWVSTIRCFQ
jgi:hypothetical protein